jgi:hypothetical protein
VAAVSDLPLAIHGLISACRDAGMKAPVAITLSDEFQRQIMVNAISQSLHLNRVATEEKRNWEVEIMGVRILVAA